MNIQLFYNVSIYSYHLFILFKNYHSPQFSITFINRDIMNLWQVNTLHFNRCSTPNKFLKFNCVRK